MPTDDALPPTKSRTQLLEDLFQEAKPLRSEYEPEWDTSFNRYIGNHWEKAAPQGLHQFTDNRIQAAVIASAAVQTEQRPRVKLNPVESNDPPIVFLTPSGALKLEQAEQSFAQPAAPTDPNAPVDPAAQAPAQPQIPIVDLTPGQIAGEEPISTELWTTLAEITKVIQQPALDPMGIPSPELPPQVTEEPIFDDQDFILVTDSTVAESLQVVVDTLLDRIGFDYKLIQNILNKSVAGHQDMLCQWSFDKGVPELVNIHQKNCWIDPTATNIDDAEYFIYAQVISADEAVERFPEEEAYIRKHASEGQLTEIEGIVLGTTDLGEPSRTDFHRDMVALVTLWKRHERFENDPAQVEASMLAGTPMSPTRSGIAQVMMIGDKVLFDEECPYIDIPIARNINIPIPHRPYGQGDPKRLEDLQQLINRLLSIAHNHYKYFQAPQQFLPQSVRDSVGSEIKNLHSHPGRTVTIPDDLFSQLGGKISLVQDPPTFSPAIVELLQLVINEFKEISGFTDVLTGKPHSGAESGKAIQSLQSAARGSIGFKSLGTELAVQQVIRLLVGMIRDFMTEQQFARSCSKYPKPVLASIKQRLKNLDFDISVEVVSGRGTSKQAEEDKARMDFQMGLETLPGALERLGRPNAQQKAEDIMNERNGLLPGQEASAGKPDRSPQDRLIESIKYADAPPEIQAQMEAKAGYKPATPESRKEHQEAMKPKPPPGDGPPKKDAA